MTDNELVLIKPTEAIFCPRCQRGPDCFAAYAVERLNSVVDESTGLLTVTGYDYFAHFFKVGDEVLCPECAVGEDSHAYGRQLAAANEEVGKL